MSEMGEMFNNLKKIRQEKRADNRESSAAYLQDRGIQFTSNNGGAHLIVEGRECFIDFWPGTGKWNCRSGKKGFGVRNLVQYIAPDNAKSEPTARLFAQVGSTDGLGAVSPAPTSGDNDAA